MLAPSRWDPMSEGTAQVQKRGRSLRTLIGPVSILLVTGSFIAGYLAFDGAGGNPSTAQASGMTPAPAAHLGAAAIPAPAAAPAVVPSLPVGPAGPTSAGGALVDIRIDSQPAGASVMLVDRGRTTFLGTTPLSAALDRSRKYELVFTHGSRPTMVRPLDPAATDRIAVELGTSSESPAATPPSATAVATTATKPPVTASAAAAVAQPERQTPRKTARSARRVASADAAPVAATKRKRANATLGAEGTLMISTKPPCEIYIDGKATGLMTPQRSIALAAGKHKITLVNEDEDIKKTISVQITAAKPTKVIANLMK